MEDSVNSQLQSLYRRYFVDQSDIIGGGVVDEAAYQASKPKVMWILREPYNMGTYSNTATLLREKVDRFYKTGKTMPSEPIPWPGAKVMGVFTHVIQHGFRGYAEDYTNDNAAAGAHCLAVTNLKKTPGRKTANLTAIREHANRHKDCWTRELEMVVPDIVLCGGTYEIVRDALRDDLRFEEKLYTSDGSRRPMNWHYHCALLSGRARETLLVGWHHPDPRGKGPMSRQYEILQNIVGALHAKGLFPYGH